jgi:hypothetical protein
MAPQRGPLLVNAPPVESTWPVWLMSMGVPRLQLNSNEWVSEGFME